MTMKKVAVSTIFYVCNYGTVLQAYATQQILDRLGYESEIIRYIPERLSNRRVLLSTGDASRSRALRNVVSIAVRTPGNIINRRIFDRFAEKHLTLTEKTYKNVQEVASSLPDAEIFMTGSDQVWNSRYNEGIDAVYYLSFVPEDKKKISYAASIGGDDFEEDEKIEIKRILERYDAISVREKSAKEAISALGIDGVEHVLDPTMLLYKDEWKKLVSPRRVNNRYLLIYTLGRDKTLIDIGAAIAKERGLKLVKIGLDFLWSLKLHKNDQFCTPNEFLSYFWYADYVVTNSFHGLCFSLNFDKQFSIVLPKTYATRLESLLEQFELTSRTVRSVGDLYHQKSSIDYTAVNKRIDDARRHSLSFLRNALQ